MLFFNFGALRIFAFPSTSVFQCWITILLKNTSGRRVKTPCNTTTSGSGPITSTQLWESRSSSDKIFSKSCQASLAKIMLKSAAQFKIVTPCAGDIKLQAAYNGVLIYLEQPCQPKHACLDYYTGCILLSLMVQFSSFDPSYDHSIYLIYTLHSASMWTTCTKSFQKLVRLLPMVIKWRPFNDGVSTKAIWNCGDCRFFPNWIDFDVLGHILFYYLGNDINQLIISILLYFLHSMIV